MTKKKLSIVVALNKFCVVVQIDKGTYKLCIDFNIDSIPK